MLLYDVTYARQRTFDKNVPWSYLQRLAGDKRCNGATAVCTNGEAKKYELRNGEWVELN